MPLFKILNFALFQAGWFAAALMQDSSVWIMLALVALHFSISPSKLADIKLLLMLLPIGLTLEAIMISLGFVTFNSAFALPIWMILLWCLLILSFNHSLKWFRDIPWGWQVLLSGGFGSASYFAADKFGALSIGEPVLLYGIAIAVVWAIQLPVMLYITKQLSAGEISCVNN